MVSKLPNKARPCGAGALHDVALKRTSGVYEVEFVTPWSDIGKK
jgi:hypothetical protein